MTFVVVGGGPTGVELAGALAELAHHTLRENFRSIDPSRTKILLVEGVDRLLPSYAPPLSQQAARSLERLGVTVRPNTRLQRIDDGRVVLASDFGSETIQSETILWGAGVQASSLGRRLAELTGADIDRQGRVLVRPDLSVPRFPNIFVLGDLAHLDQDNHPLPGVAPVAMQQGSYVAKLIQKRLRGRSVKPFRYKNRGSMAVIGRAAAVAELGRFKFHGVLAWLVWLFVHLIHLVEYENRVLVLVQWGWNYFTRNRSARLITYEESPGSPAPRVRTEEPNPVMQRGGERRTLRPEATAPKRM
jgi:NADH dehydrogenase